MKKILAVAGLISVFLISGTDADVQPASMQFLKMPPDARGSGLAGSVIASAENAAALYWNPGALAEITQTEIMATFHSYIQGSLYGYCVCAMKLGPGTMAAGMTLLTFGETVVYDNFWDPGTVRKNAAGAFAAGYGLNLGSWMATGVAVKYASESVDDTAVAGILFDAGVRIGLLNDFLRFGILCQNIGYASDTAPMNFRIGAAVNFVTGRLKVTPLLGADLQPDTKNAVNIGCEGCYNGVYFLRLGYNFDLGGSDIGGMEGFAVGLGYTFSRFHADMAWAPMGFLGQSVMFTLSAKLGKTEKKS